MIAAGLSRDKKFKKFCFVLNSTDIYLRSVFAMTSRVARRFLRGYR